MADAKRLLPIRNNAIELKSKETSSNLKGGVSTANTLCQNGNRVLNKASLPSGGKSYCRTVSSTEIDNHCVGSFSRSSSRKTANLSPAALTHSKSSAQVVSEKKRGSPGLRLYASETVGVGLHKTTSWMDCDSAAGRRQLNR